MQPINITFIEGKNCIGKTMKIREMLSYDEEPYYRYLGKKVISINNSTFRVLQIFENSLITRFFLKKRCKVCKDIFDTHKKLIDQREKMMIFKSKFNRAEGLEQQLTNEKKTLKESKKKIESYRKKQQKIMKKSNINFNANDFFHVDRTYEEYKEIGYYDYTDIDDLIDEELKTQSQIERESGSLKREIRKLKNKQGFKNLKEALEFNEWKIKDLLVKHSREHDIDIWITLLNKHNLTQLFNDIAHMKINRLFIESLNKNWLITELEERFERIICFSPVIKDYLKLPQNTNEIYVETKSSDEEVVFRTEEIIVQN
jgi:hypothetical protein